MTLTDAQKKIIYIVLVAISGLGVSTVSKALHLAPEVVQPWLDILDGITPVIAGAWGLSTFTTAGVVRTASTLPAADASQALSQVSDATKVLVAKSVPDVATVVVKDSAGNGLAKLAADPKQPDIVTETQNEADAKAGTKT